MSKLLEYLKAWAARIGYPTAEGSVTYNLPAFSEGETTAETTISAPGDGYIQICAWGITGAGVYNHSIKTPDRERYISSGSFMWVAESRFEINAWIPCAKGDLIRVQIYKNLDYTPGGNFVFYPRAGS